jgi:hypothetical protein
MRTTIPNSLAFGLLGVVVGQLYHSLGPLTLPLLLVPAVIARTTFASYLELQKAHEGAVQVFVKAIEAKDRYTAGHCERVAKYAAYIGEELGFSPARMEHLRYAALMHDVGKLAVPSPASSPPTSTTSSASTTTCASTSSRGSTSCGRRCRRPATSTPTSTPAARPARPARAARTARTDAARPASGVAGGAAE